MLFAVLSEEEVKHAIFSMNPHSALGPNGFTSLLYRSWWLIICEDVVRVVVMFFEQSRIAQGFKSNIVTFIPKKPGAYRIYDFRSIDMGNFAFKIIIEILSDRLGGIVSHILSP